MTCGPVVDIPRIKSRASSHIGGVIFQGDNRLLIKRAEIAAIVLVEGLSLFGDHYVSIVWRSSSDDTRTIAPKIFLDFFGRAISLFTIRAFFDTQRTIGITFKLLAGLVALFDVHTCIILFHPGVDMLDIEGYRFA